MPLSPRGPPSPLACSSAHREGEAHVPHPPLAAARGRRRRCALTSARADPCRGVDPRAPAAPPSERPGAPMSADATALRQLLTSLDGRSYGSYKQLKGSYDLGPCRLLIDHVQVDPYAPPSPSWSTPPRPRPSPTPWIVSPSCSTSPDRTVRRSRSSRRSRRCASGSRPRGWTCSHPTAVTPGIWHDPARSSCTRP